MRRVGALALSLLLAACAAPGLSRGDGPLRILFVGNSLTYYNDLPRIVAVMIEAEGAARPVRVDMLASGGTSIADSIDSGALDQALRTQPFDIVVLQDIGGFPACDRAFPGCKRAIDSVCEATRRVRSAGMRPILYGTWQGTAGAQKELSAALRAEAGQCRLEWADAGAAMHRFAEAMPDPPPWLGDGHPSLAGSWIAAAALTRTIVGGKPAAAPAIANFCRTRWQGGHLGAASLASTQLQATQDCEMPAIEVMSAALRAAGSDD